MNTPVWHAYRMASQNNDREAQARVVEDILLLPQRILTRSERGGGNGRRLTSIIRARCRDVGAELRHRYGCVPDRVDNAELGIVTKPLTLAVRRQGQKPNLSTADTDVDHSSGDDSADDNERGCSPQLAKRASSSAVTVAVKATQHEADSDASDAAQNDHSDTNVEDSESDSDVDHDDDEDIKRAWQRGSHPANDPDTMAAKRAQHHARNGHLGKAAQTLYCTTTLADLREVENQQAMRDLHPALPDGSIIPQLPPGAPAMILEDDSLLFKILRSSNDGAASGPSGWGGNMISSLIESDICRDGIRTLLKDIINGNLPESARQLLLASRAIAPYKRNGGIRPIAMGELFYRLAGVIAVRRIALTAGRAAAAPPVRRGHYGWSGAHRALAAGRAH